MDLHNLFHPSDRAMARARLKRRAAPIHAYLGSGNGSGKSLLMVYDTIPSLDAGRPVLSTVRLLDFRNPRPCDDPTCTFPGHPDHGAAHPMYIPFTDYQQLLDFRDGDVLMDEITGIASSRQFASMPVQVQNFLVQMRRRNIALRWSSTNWARSDIIIREVTTAATLTIPFISRTHKSEPGEPPMLWRDRLLFFSRTYDAALMDDFDARGADAGAMKPHNLQLFWRPGALAGEAYNTLDPVLSLGFANEVGICVTCGGSRKAHPCSCVKSTKPREPRHTHNRVATEVTVRSPEPQQPS